jgi:hypothetical protein
VIAVGIFNNRTSDFLFSLSLSDSQPGI